MPEFLLLFAGKLGIPEPLRRAAIITAGVALIIVAAFITLKIHDHRVVADHERKVQQRAAPATDKAAEQRANDTIANAKKEEELHSAVHSVPDAAPAGPSHALACKRLSNAGKHPASCR